MTNSAAPKRVKARDAFASEIKVGDVLVIQHALIREDGSHKLPVVKVERNARFTWLTFEGGRRERYLNRTIVNFGIEY